MSEIIKNGKKHISTKKQPTIETFSADDIAGGANRLKIDDELKREIEEQGLEYRFINVTQLKKNLGRHANDWMPYKRKSTSSLNEFKWGQDPDGYTVSGDSILAVKPKELAEKARALIAFKNKSLTNINKVKADELRQFAKDSGLSAQIHEGYEENE